MDSVIKVENLGKKYLISHQRSARYSTLRESIATGVKNSAKRSLSIFNKKYRVVSNKKEEFWALKNVSFEIKEGERIGIIGRNGAGKSTLLKLLSRITEPAAGKFTIRGRVASLLEVGTGFHPELTGRENIFLDGAILGMTRNEIKSKFDEIVSFAEVEKFLDTPVKRYSSGMYVRLAFAVAAHLEPEILIVDEVLAVGDVQFQKKCLGKMQDVSTKEGRTILFVSHNMGAITALCNRGIYLSNGELMIDDTIENAVSEYLNHGTSSSFIYSGTVIKKPTVTKAYFVDEEENVISQLTNGEKIHLVMEIENPDNSHLEVALSFWDSMRRPLWNFTHAMHGLKGLPVSKKIKVKLVFVPPKITSSDIIVDFALTQEGSGAYYHHVIAGLKCNLLYDNKGEFLQRYPDWPILCSVVLNTQIIEK